MSNVAADERGVSGTCVQVQGWSLAVETGEPMVLDVELAERLGFGRPRDFRKLLERLISEDVVRRTEWRATVARQTSTGRGGHRGTVTTYHLTEVGALLAIAKSRTPKANEITRQMVEVFVAFRAGRLTPTPTPALPAAPDRDASQAMGALAAATDAALRAQLEHADPRWGLTFGALTRLISDVEGLLTNSDSETAMWGLVEASRNVMGTSRYRKPEKPDPVQTELSGMGLPASVSFFASRCVLDPDARIPVKVLREAYDAWRAATGQPEVNSRAFGRLVRSQGARSVTVRHAGKVVEGFAGLRLV